MSIRIHLFVLIFSSGLSFAQDDPPCGLKYGTDEDRRDIQWAQLNGSLEEITAAFKKGKETRGVFLGCPEINYLPYILSDTTPINLADVEKLWLEEYSPRISAIETNCPEIGRNVPSLALGSYYALDADAFEDTVKLNEITNGLLGTQYSRNNAPCPLTESEGVFGYYNSSRPLVDDCALKGIAWDLTQAICNEYPEICIEYVNGPHKGLQFAVADHRINDDQIVGDIGGAGFDHAWSGIYMIESAIHTKDLLQKTSYTESAILAGNWAINHPIASNHNYVAKLVWLLAELYEWTGDEKYKTSMIDKIEKSLIQGVLTDFDNDGFVDGLDIAIPFSDLAINAQVPGRNWDGHNTLPWYHSMNTWAMAEAYVALRDRGDTSLANIYRPYTILMLDNLAHEFVNLGTLSEYGVGIRDVPYALLIGIWKIAQYENEDHPLWNKAIAAIWNSGIFENPGEEGVNLGLYLLILKKIPYVPLHVRDSFGENFELTTVSIEEPSRIYPNPSNDLFNLNIGANQLSSSSIQVWNPSGQQIQFETSTSDDNILSLRLLTESKGLFFVKLQGICNEETIRVIKL